MALTRYLFPLAMTVASYGLVPRSLALVDEWLSWPERMLGITHPFVYHICDSWGLLPTLGLMYNFVRVEVIVILLWFALVRQDLHPSMASRGGRQHRRKCRPRGILACPGQRAFGPLPGYAAYGHPPPPTEAAFLADFSALREGRFTALDAPQGSVTVPSFHVVFAILFTWVLRRERWLYPVAIALNAGVIAATFPVGWQSPGADLPAGAVWAVGAIVVVRRIQGVPSRLTAADDARTASRPSRVPNHRGRWSLRNLRSGEST